MGRGRPNRPQVTVCVALLQRRAQIRTTLPQGGDHIIDQWGLNFTSNYSSIQAESNDT